MTKRIYALAAGLATAIAGSAALASGPVSPAEVPAIPPTYVPVASYDWTGGHVGLTGGTTLGSNQWTGSPSSDWDGTQWGLTGGYDWQSGPWVYGAALDYTPSEIDATGAGTTTVQDGYALRGRMGYAFDRTLVYGTAGLASGDVSGTFGGTTASDRMNGWVAGLGVEQALTDSISMNAEYLYTDLGTMTHAGGSSDVNYGTVRVGVNFRF